MTEDGFRNALMTVLVVGFLIMGVGGAMLYFVFRAYGTVKALRKSHVAMIAGLIAFILTCCFLIYRSS